MRFEVFHHGLLGRNDIVAVDMIQYPGLWGLCFSHHVPNNNHPRYAADTTTEGVLRFLACESIAPLEAYTLTTHHFDADALLPVWALLNPAAALDRRDLLERVARSGDFFMHTDDESAKLNFVVEALHLRLRDSGARGERLIDDDLTRRCFEWLLPRWGDLLADPTLGEDLWRQPMQEMLADLDYLAGPGRVAELWDYHASLVESDHALDAHALNSACRNDLLIVWRTDAPTRWIDVRPAIGWYEITSMPHRPRYNLAALAARLNLAEQKQGHAPHWRHDPGPARLRAPSSGLSQAALLAIVKGWLDEEPEEAVPASYRADVREHFSGWPRHATYASHQRFAGAAELRYAPGAAYGGLYPLPGRRLRVTSFGADVAGDLASLPAALDPRPDAPLLFAVSDDFYWNARAPIPLELRVTYQDQARGSFWVEFDTWDNPFHPAAPITLIGDGAAHTASFWLEGARLGNSQDGGDFRLARSHGARLEVRAVTLSKL
jgi:hypothetical protein